MWLQTRFMESCLSKCTFPESWRSRFHEIINIFVSLLNNFNGLEIMPCSLKLYMKNIWIYTVKYWHELLPLDVLSCRLGKELQYFKCVFEVVACHWWGQPYIPWASMILPHSLWLTNVNSQVLATVGSLSHEQKYTQTTRSSNDWGKGLTYEGVRESWKKQGNHKVSSSWLYINFYSLKKLRIFFSFEIYVFFEMMLLIKLKKKKVNKKKWF